MSLKSIITGERQESGFPFNTVVGANGLLVVERADIISNNGRPKVDDRLIVNGHGTVRHVGHPSTKFGHDDGDLLR